MSFKSVVKRVIPKFIINFYHGFISFFTAAYYGFPSKKMIVIGVTGTNGKTTTANLITALLSSFGEKVALSSSVNFKIGNREWLNTYKMTMPGRGILPKFLSQAVKEGSRYAVIETSSEGLVQNRHLGIYYDVAVITNLTPEHIDSHGNFYNYQKAKKILFKSLARSWRKNVSGKHIPTIIVANSDDPHAPYYLNSAADLKITYGLKPSTLPWAHLLASNIKVSMSGVDYKIGNDQISLRLKGKFDVYNSLAALAVIQMLDLPFQEAEKALVNVTGVPGRLEVLKEKPFMVLVDYAVEPESMRQLYETLNLWGIGSNHVIHVLGSAGGGRDVARRPILGEMVGEKARLVIITNEDPYDDDPQAIIDQIAVGAQAVGKVLNKDLFKIIDRRQAIAYALSQASKGDLVLVTGKGAEQKIALGSGQYIDWDDRQVIKEELGKI